MNSRAIPSEVDRRLQAMASALLVLLVVLAEPLLAAQKEPPLLSLESLPNFAFTDDRMELAVQVSRNAERPAFTRFNVRPYAAKASLSAPGQSQERELKLAPYKDRSEQALFAVDFRKLRHGQELVFKAAFTTEPVAETATKVLLQYITKAGPKVHTVLDHFEAEEGQRVIFLVPRPDEATHRRWYPVKTLRRLLGQEDGKALLVGAPYGQTVYAEELDASLAPNGHPFVKEIAKPALVPIFNLVVAARKHLHSDAKTVFLFPGMEDIRLGTPPSEYYMALQAVAAVFDSDPTRTRQVILATPPPQGDEARGKHYHDLALRVSQERHLDLVELLGVFDEDQVRSTLDERSPSREVQKAMAARLAQDRGLPKTALGALIPVSGFLIAAIAVFWLWGYARYRVPARPKTPKRKVRKKKRIKKTPPVQ